jgi:hypothetical protein
VSAEDGHEQRGFIGLAASGTPLSVSEPVRGEQISGAGDLDVQLRVATDELGVHRWMAMANGASSVSRVLFRFTPLEANLGTENLSAAFDPESGAYAVSEPIALVGQWKVEVGVRRDGVPDDVRVPFTFSASTQEGVPLTACNASCRS